MKRQEIKEAHENLTDWEGETIQKFKEQLKPDESSDNSNAAKQVDEVKDVE
jgi:hypothetical protein